MKLEDFNFSLPNELIAKRPSKNKKKSKLLICKSQKIVDFTNITNYLNKNDVLVFNDTKVLPSIIIGKFKDKQVKVTLLEEINNFIWHAFIKSSIKIKIGDKILFKDYVWCEVIEKKMTIAKVKFNSISIEMKFALMKIKLYTMKFIKNYWILEI